MLTRRLRHQAKKMQLAKKVVLVAIGILCVCSLLWSYSSFNEEVLPVNANAGLQQEQSKILQWPTWRDVLFSGIPSLTSRAEPKLIVKEQKSSNGQQVLRETILFFTNVDIRDIRSLFRAEIPVLAAVKPATQTVTAVSLPNFPKFGTTKDIPKGKPLVGLYYTHTAESFVPSAGVTHRPGGQRGDIVDVGEAFVKRLANYDIAVLQNTTINDSPSFMKAYGVSEITVKKMLSENPSIQMIFDIHRDAEKRENTTIIIDGVQVARIMFVVTTGQQGLAQPHWQSNHAFAKLIDAKLNQRYPGFSRGIRMDDWRYNQHLHPRALLVEIGCQENTKEEAERGMELFGDIVSEIIAENNKQ
ncbi:MAG: stage II sporulation protein P [Sporomusaceae bacterium]|nr:stage II sporulation protein P [Sporomusaceae bacterium]